MRKSARTFESAWDTWVVILLALGSLLSIAATTWAAIHEPALSTTGRSLVVLAGLLAPVLLLWLMRTTDYTVGADLLLVRSGPFRWRVPYDSIERVAPSRTLLSGPAGSLDRLAIKRRHKLDLPISPREKRAFLDHLAARTPHLEHRGDRLERPSIPARKP